MNTKQGKQKKIFSTGLVLILLASLLLSSGTVFAQEGSPDDEPSPEAQDEPPAAPDEREYEDQAVKRWTIMVYMAADNNLESAAIDDFLEMAQVGSTSNMNIVVQLDRAPGYDTRYGDWTNTRRFYVTKDRTPIGGVGVGEQNMGSAVALRSFINWTKLNYPAQKYALVLWNHGGGFQPMEDDITSAGVAWDDTNSGDYLTSKELSVVLNQVTGGGAQKLELVGFDACLMAQMEVHQHVKSYAKYGVGSEKTEPNDGWPYDTILNWLKYHTTTDGLGLANMIADQYWVSYSYGETQSAVRYDSAYNTVVTRLNTFSNQLMARIDANPSFRNPIMNALNASLKLDSAGNFVDLYDFARCVRARAGSGTALYNAANNLMAGITTMVTRNRRGIAYVRARGVTIFFPKNSSTWDTWKSTYEFNQYLASQTRWNEFLNKFYQPNTSYGFDSQFNGSATGWQYTSAGAPWSVTSDYVYTNGSAGKYSALVYTTRQFSNSQFEYSASVKRSAASDSVNYLFVRTGTNLNSTGGLYPGYMFGYRNNGKYLVLRMNTNGTGEFLTSQNTSSAIVRNEWNTLRVVGTGLSLQFYINGSLIYTVMSPAYSSGYVGIEIYNDGFFQVDWATFNEF